MAKWVTQTTIRMHMTDAAGVVFYANLFVMAHDCYESWLEQYLRVSEILQKGLQIPIVHAEADYKLPIRVSDSIMIELTLAKKQTTSFTMQYTFLNAAGQQAATVQTVHVVIDARTRQPIEIPSFLQDALASL